MGSKASTILTAKEQDYFYDMIESKNGISKQTILDFFAYYDKRGIRFKPTDVIHLQQKRIALPINEGTPTTVGKFISNKFIYEDFKLFGYVQKPWTGKFNSKINEFISDALIMKYTTRDAVGEFIDKTQWLFGGPLSDLIVPTGSLSVMRLPPKAKKRKAELLKQYEKEIAAGNAVVVSKIEKEICDIAMAEMREVDDPAIVIFDSGCGIDLYNNYKTMYVMKGPIRDANSKSINYNIVTSSLDEGIKKDEFPYIADSITLGAYAKGKDTGFAGYEAKKYDTLFKDCEIIKESDCGTKQYFEFTLTEAFARHFIYMNFVEGGKIKSLTMENIESYIGKTLLFRHPMYCKNEAPHYCEVCCGLVPKETEIKNIGYWCKRIANSQLNANMKTFHDISIKLYTLTPEDLIGNFRD